MNPRAEPQRGGDPRTDSRRAFDAKTGQPLTVPMRPIATGGMCHAQRMDLQAAIAGKITWAEYNRKWGGRALSL